MMSDTTSPIRIERITDDQFLQCWQLRLRALHDHPEAFGQPYDKAASMSPEEIRTTYESFWTGGDNQVFIAIAGDDTVAGMIGIVRETSERERHRAAIWGMYVAPEYRGQALARQLLKQAIAYAGGVDGLLQIHLTVATANTAATRLYEREGFVRWGRMPRADIVDGVALDYDFMVLMLDATASGTAQHPGGTHS